MGSQCCFISRPARPPPIKSAPALGAAQFHRSLGEYKMTIACDIPTQMIVDDSSSSFSSSPETSNLAEVMKARRRKKKKRSPMVGNTFSDLYKLTGQSLGEGSYGKVETCVNVFTGIEYAVKIIEKVPGLFSRSKILKEIEIYHLCRGEQNIIQLIEYFEEANCFCLVFEKMLGGPLLDHIQRLLVKDSGARLDANQVLDHPWILYGGNSNSLMTPTVLRRQTSIKDLEDFASRAMAVNRAVEDEDEKVNFPTRNRVGKSETWSIKPSSSPSCSSLAPSSELLSKRRRSRVNFWDKMNKFCSIDELDLESDFFMKAIV